MRLKSFHAKTMSEAMRQVRDELGDDAIIVTSREEKSGWVKITAAIDQEIPQPEPEEGPDAESVIEEVRDTLLRHRVPAAVGDKLMAAAMARPARNASATLANALHKTFGFEKPFFDGLRPRPVALVGPPGAGKTLLAAKLAARAVLDGLKPAVITTDIARAGGVEQLSAFLDILSLPLAQAEDAKSLKAALAGAPREAPVIVDTGGLNPFDPGEMKDLAKLLHAADMQPALVLPAGTDAEESAEIALTFSVLGIKRLVPTRLDFSRHLGGILSAADRARLSFSEGSHTPQVAKGLVSLTPEILAGLFIPSSPPKGRTKK